MCCCCSVVEALSVLWTRTVVGLFLVVVKICMQYDKGGHEASNSAVQQSLALQLALVVVNNEETFQIDGGFALKNNVVFPYNCFTFGELVTLIVIRKP